MMTQKQKIISVLLGLVLAGCTRAKEDTAKVSISLPHNIISAKDGAMSGSSEKLVHVVINVTGEGMDKPGYLLWDAHSGNGETAPPSVFTVDSINVDKERLVQVLAVYKNSESSKISFYYGDVTQMISPSNPDVSVSISPVGMSQDVVVGRVAGRVLTSANAGPTGLVSIKYSPAGSGKPALLIEQTYVVNGWFTVMMLSGASFDYILPSGARLFNTDGPVSLDSDLFNPTGKTNVFKVSLPVHTRMESSGGGAMTPAIDEASIFVWGYWAGAAGVDLSSKVVCDNLAAGSFSNLKLYSSPPSAANPALTYSRLAAGGAFPLNSALLSVSTPSGIMNGKGGIVVSGSTCGAYSTSNASDAFANFLHVGNVMLDGNGNDATAGFRYIFRAGLSDTNIFTTTVGASTTALAGVLLPGISGKISSLKFYKRIMPSSAEERIETPVCSEIVKSTSLYTFAGDVSTFSGDGSFTATLNVSSSELNSGANVAGLVACPVMTETNMMAPIGFYSTVRTGGGGAEGMATKLVVAYGGSKMPNSTCIPITLEGRTASGQPGSVPNGVSVTLGASDGAVAFYQYSGCSTSFTSTAISGGLGVNAKLFVKRSTAGTVSSDLTLTPTNGLSVSVLRIGFEDPPGTPNKAVRVIAPSTIAAHECLPLSYETWHEAGADSMLVDFASSYSFTLPAVAGLQLYWGFDSKCEGGAPSSFGLGAGTKQENYYFKYSGAATTLNLQPSSSPFAGAGGTFPNGSAITVIQPGAPIAARLEMGLPISAETCQPITLRVVDSMGRTTPAAGSTTLNYSYNGSGTPPAQSGFYSDPGCTASMGSGIQIAAGDTKVHKYFRWAAPGSMAISATVASGTNLTFAGISTTVGAAPVAAMVVIPENMSYIFGSGFSGNPTKWVNEGKQFNLTIKAISPLGNPVYTYIDTNPASINLGADYPGLSCNPLVWSPLPNQDTATATCWYIDPSNFFSTVLMGFSTSNYPAGIQSHSTPGYLRIIRKAEATTMKDYLMTRNFGHSTANQCQPILYTRGTGSGNYTGAIANAAFTSLTISAASGVQGFYTAQDCSSGAITDVQLATDESSKIVYAKLTGGGPVTSLGINGEFATDLLTSSPLSTGSFAVSSASAYTVSMSPVQAVGGCSPVMVVRADSNGNAVPSSGAESMTMATSGFTSTWHTDPICSSADTSSGYAWTTGQRAALIYIRATSVGSGSVNIGGAFTGSASGITTGY